MKRLLAIGDPHVGHIAGWVPKYARADKNRFPRLYELQKQTYDWVEKTINKLKPIDVLLMNGDGIDGKGALSGGRELWTTDRNEQVSALCELLAMTEAPIVIIVYGTKYHVGHQELWEKVAAKELASYSHIKHIQQGGNEFFTVEGVVFNAKHKISGSQTPVSRATSLQRELVWQRLWIEAGRRPDVKVTLRSHVHYHIVLSDGRRMVATIPPLQAAHTEFGSHECVGEVDYGMMSFDCEKGSFTWQSHLFVPPAESPQLFITDNFLSKKPSKSTLKRKKKNKKTG